MNRLRPRAAQRGNLHLTVHSHGLLSLSKEHEILTGDALIARLAITEAVVKVYRAGAVVHEKWHPANVIDWLMRNRFDTFLGKAGAARVYSVREVETRRSPMVWEDCWRTTGAGVISHWPGLGQ